MKINPEIELALENLPESVPKKDALCYIISIYFDCVSSTTSDVVKTNVSMLRVFELDGKNVHWNISLFGETDKKDSWDWVISEYRMMFYRVNKTRKGPKNSCITRMKKFFSENPEVRKDDVIQATKMYISNLDNPDYITSAHYFIFKGKGSTKTSLLEDWLENLEFYKEQTPSSDNEDLSISMQ